jgi:glyoxylase-like metal-dependent hydrolase (beta-lactamase superfamily II)
MQIKSLSVPFPPEWGKGDATNVYILNGQSSTFVDAGLDSPSNRKFILRALKKDVPHTVDRILVTHGHLDHFGLSAYIQHETGAEILIHEADAEALKDYGTTLYWFDDVFDLAVEGGFLKEDLISAKLQMVAAIGMMATPKDFKTFTNLELDLGEEKVVSIDLPGHTKGSVGYAVGNSIFAGDVAKEGSTLVGIFKDEIASIQKLKAFKDVYTGHGRTPIGKKDLEELEAHFISRLEEVLRAAAGGNNLKGIMESVYPTVMDTGTNFIRKIIPLRQAISYLRYLEEEGYIAKKGPCWTSFKTAL